MYYTIPDDPLTGTIRQLAANRQTVNHSYGLVVTNKFPADPVNTESGMVIQ